MVSCKLRLQGVHHPTRLLLLFRFIKARVVFPRMKGKFNESNFLSLICSRKRINCTVENPGKKFQTGKSQEKNSSKKKFEQKKFKRKKSKKKNANRKKNPSIQKHPVYQEWNISLGKINLSKRKTKVNVWKNTYGSMFQMQNDNVWKVHVAKLMKR